MVEAIIFDFDDTLVADEASAERAFRETGDLAVRRYGLDAHALCEAARAQARSLWQSFPSIEFVRRIGISSWEGLWAEFEGAGDDLTWLREHKVLYRTETWNGALTELGVDDPGLAMKMGRLFVEKRRAISDVYLDVREGLTSLKDKYRLGLLTNGAVDLQQTKIRASSLGKFFECVVISGALGFAKPDPKTFAHAIDLLGVSADRVVMVGDSLERDIGGAQLAGLRGVWMNRDGRINETGVVPEGEVTDLFELAGLLEALRDAR